MKKNGLKKATIFLSILPSDILKNVTSHLSIFELDKIYNFASIYGGFNNIKRLIDSSQLKYIQRDLNKILKKDYKFNVFSLSLSSFLLLAGILILILHFNKTSIDNFLNYFIISGYSAIAAPSIYFFLSFKGKFNWKYNFTNSTLLLRHLLEGLISSIFLIILLMQINAFYPEIIDKEINIFSMIYAVLFIPLLEEILYRYILMTLILKKEDRIFKIIISAFIFSIMHFPFQSFLCFFLYFLSACILCILYNLENYIFPSFIAHSLANLIILIL
ncbi:MAG: lysostaphin resistance A-like protein [Exilispira sp.]